MLFRSKLSVTFAYTYWEILSTAMPAHVIGENRNLPFNLTAAIEIGALALSSGQALKNGNPYALLSVAGAATSIIPSVGGTKTLSSVINSQGRGALDTQNDVSASATNLNNNSIAGLTKTTDKFSLF